MTHPRAGAVAELARRVRAGGVVVLSGAGLSTESGIPDYRGPSGAALRRHAPMTHQDFVHDAAARRRYWARSHAGWHLMATAVPNPGHVAVAALERSGLVDGVITQNVDGLHTRAGSSTVVELHGRLDRVTCLSCGRLSARAELATRLERANPGWVGRATEVNPDGDVDLPAADLDGFITVDCAACGGVLKPDVVYFGGTVPPERVSAAFALVDRAALVLVLGSSLAVFSGRRFVVHAARAGTPVAIVNQGGTRCDGIAALRIEAPLGQTLQEVVTQLGHPGVRDPAASIPC